MTQDFSILDKKQRKARGSSTNLILKLRRGEDVDGLSLWENHNTLTVATDKLKEHHFSILQQIASGSFSVKGTITDAERSIQETLGARITKLEGLSEEVRSIQEQRKRELTDDATPKENPCYETVLQLIQQERDDLQLNLENMIKAIQRAFDSARK